PRRDRERGRARGGTESALRRRGRDLRLVRRGRRHDRRREVRGTRLRDLTGGDVDAHRDGEGTEGDRDRGVAEGGAARGDRDSADAGAAEVRNPRTRRAEGRAAPR